MPKTFTLTSNYYRYYASELKTIDTKDDAYLMLFESDSKKYYLASMYFDGSTYGAYFTGNGGLYGYELQSLKYDEELFDPSAEDVRAVVSLEPSVKMLKSTDGWTY